MNNLARLATRTLTMTPKFHFQFPHTHSETHDKVTPKPNSAGPDSKANHQLHQHEAERLRP